MAPKKNDKVKEPEAPPSVWMPLNPAKKEMISCIGAVATHRRNGSDAVRGKLPLAGGRFRLLYEVTSPASSAGFGLVVGVCSDVFSPPAPAADEGKKDKKKGGGAPPPLPYDVPSKTPFVASSHNGGWGFCPSNGRIAITDDAATKGLFDGVHLGKQIHDVPMSSVRSAHGMSVAVELYIPPYDPIDAAMSRRRFNTSLHPIDMRRQPMESLATRRPYLGFRINGGDLIDSGVQSLPSAVYPWVCFGRDGDCVALVSMEKMDEEPGS